MATSFALLINIFFFTLMVLLVTFISTEAIKGLEAVDCYEKTQEIDSNFDTVEDCEEFIQSGIQSMTFAQFAIIIFPTGIIVTLILRFIFAKPESTDYDPHDRTMPKGFDAP